MESLHIRKTTFNSINLLIKSNQFVLKKFTYFKGGKDGIRIMICQCKATLVKIMPSNVSE